MDIIEMLKDDYIYACCFTAATLILIKLVFEPLEKLYYAIKNRRKRNTGKRYKDYYQYKKADKQEYLTHKLLKDQEYEIYLYLKSLCDSKELLVLPKMNAENFSNLKSTNVPVDFLICNKKFNIIAGIDLNMNNKGKQVEDIFHTIKKPIFVIQTHEEIYKEQLTNIINFVYDKYVKYT